ncbi:hypothetical protein ACGFSI_40715 [Streptomyces virginiae]
MLALALADAEQARSANVGFLKGAIGAIPLPTTTVDVANLFNSAM